MIVEIETEDLGDEYGQDLFGKNDASKGKEITVLVIMMELHDTVRRHDAVVSIITEMPGDLPRNGVGDDLD